MLKHLVISNSNELVRVTPDRIIYITSDGNYSSLVLSGNIERIFSINLSSGKAESKATDENTSDNYIKLKKVYFADDNTCSYYIPVSGNDTLCDTINRARINEMETFYNAGVGYVKSWTLAKIKSDSIENNGWYSEFGKFVITSQYYQNKNIISISYDFYEYLGDCSPCRDKDGFRTFTFDKKTKNLFLLTKKILIFAIVFT